jgi:hypothetical protein
MGNNPASRDKVGAENQLLVGFENVGNNIFRNL